MTAAASTRRRRMVVAGIRAASTVGAIVLLLASLAPSSEIGAALRPTSMGIWIRVRGSGAAR